MDTLGIDPTVMALACTYVDLPKAHAEEYIEFRDLPVHGNEIRWLQEDKSIPRSAHYMHWRFIVAEDCEEDTAAHLTTNLDIVVVDGWLVVDHDPSIGKPHAVCPSHDSFWKWEHGVTKAMHDIWDRGCYEMEEDIHGLVLDCAPKPCPSDCVRTCIRMPFRWAGGTMGGFDEILKKLEFLVFGNDVSKTPGKPGHAVQVQACLLGPLKQNCAPCPLLAVSPQVLSMTLHRAPDSDGHDVWTEVMLGQGFHHPLFAVAFEGSWAPLGPQFDVLEIDICCQRTGRSLMDHFVITTHEYAKVAWVAPCPEATPCREWLTTQRWGMDIQHGVICRARCRSAMTNLIHPITILGHVMVTGRKNLG